MIFENLFDPFLAHIGTPHAGDVPHSGRFRWGSGDHPFQRYVDFYTTANRLSAMGKSPAEIAEALGILNREGKPDLATFRRRYSNAKAEYRAARTAECWRLYEQGMTKTAIAEKLGVNESTVRSLMDMEKAERNALNRVTANILKDYIDEHRYVDVSAGVNIQLGVTQNRLDNAIDLLKTDGYNLNKISIENVGTDHNRWLLVMTPPDCTYSELLEHKYDIRFPGQDTKVVDSDGSIFNLGIEKAECIDSSRIMIRYNEEGGLDRDGYIQLRPGVDDISLGSANYAQVRIGVDGTHYLKGMAAYDTEGMPPGIDIIFNTNKHVGTDKYDVFKPMKEVDDGDIDWANPFGATVTQLHYKDKDGKDHLSACNIVRKDSEWDEWNRNLAAQFLSKQSTFLAERQLGLTIAERKKEFDDICALTNPAVKKELLLKFADKCDALATELKAAPFPNQQIKVIMPNPKLKDGEAYCPTYPDGTRLALVRYPHGGTFEIQEVTIRNTGSPAAKVFSHAPDAIVINHNAADKLSGADFDGDFVITIPQTDKVRIRSRDQLPGLVGFDAKEQYHGYEGMKVLSKEQTQIEMGKVTNLIADMTLKGANDDDLAAAVRHSMVIIDANKHKLDYKRSEKENRIAELKKIYQGNEENDRVGASTLITRAKSPVNIPERKDWFASSTSIDPVTGEKKYKETGDTYLKGKLEGVTKSDGGYVTVRKEKDGRLYYLKKDPDTGKNVRVYAKKEDFTWIKEEPRLTEVKRMDVTKDAYTLTSGGSKANPGYKMEGIYANFANEMKGLGNAARLEYTKTPNQERDPKAAVIFKAEVDSINAKLANAKAKSPLERQAQLMANREISVRKAANPDMSKEDLKRLKGQAIDGARKKLNSKKPKIDFTDKEWEAVESKAISHSKLMEILSYADLDKLRERATPRDNKVISESAKGLAKSLAAAGYTQAQIAERLGISASSVSKIIKGKAA